MRQLRSIQRWLGDREAKIRRAETALGRERRAPLADLGRSPSGGEVIKGFGTPVNLQNSVLYFFGCLLALAAYAVPPADGSTRVGFLTGYSLLPVVLICFQAFQGLAVAWVLKRGAGAVSFPRAVRVSPSVSSAYPAAPAGSRTPSSRTSPGRRRWRSSCSCRPSSSASRRRP